MTSFTTKGNSYDETIKIVENMKIFTLVGNLSGRPASMTHASMTKEI